MVEEYYRIQGGRPEKPAAVPKKRKPTQPKQIPEKTEAKKPRKSRGVDEDADADAADLKDLPDWVPRTKNWEAHVDNVETIFREQETNNLFAYLIWKNGKKSKVSIDTCYDRCPKTVSSLIRPILFYIKLTASKMLKFYERHL